MLITTVMTKQRICQHSDFDPGILYQATDSLRKKEKTVAKLDEKIDHFVSDSIFKWDDKLLDWVPVTGKKSAQKVMAASISRKDSSSEPIVVEWKLLMDIRYKLRYFEELDMEIYAPVFSEALKALDGQEIIIEGFVIPFDESGGLLALSANPFSSCFFCGKASPASIMSMHLQNNNKRYKLDDYKKFRGILSLNHDDPNEFYYILREARAE